jgi:hypothetical protein
VTEAADGPAGNNAVVSEQLIAELESLARRLNEHAGRGDDKAIAAPLLKLEQVADEIGKSWSGSNMGYQSCVYYAGFRAPPPGAHFDSECGFLGQFQGTTVTGRSTSTTRSSS